MPATTSTRCFAGHGDVRLTEVTLIGEADVEGDVGECAARLLHKFGGDLNSSFDEVSMWRQPRTLPERAARVSQSQSRYLGEYLGCRLLGEMQLDVFPHAAKGAG